MSYYAGDVVIDIKTLEKYVVTEKYDYTDYIELKHHNPELGNQTVTKHIDEILNYDRYMKNTKRREDLYKSELDKIIHSLHFATKIDKNPKLISLLLGLQDVYEKCYK